MSTDSPTRLVTSAFEPIWISKKLATDDLPVLKTHLKLSQIALKASK